MTPALAARVHQLAAEREHRAAVAAFRARRIADRQARSDALIADVIDVLARALDAAQSSPRECRGCTRQLAPRVRRCPSCQYLNAPATAAA